MVEVCAEFLGEVTEWPNVRDWKSRVGQKPTGGSNPPLSAFITSILQGCCIASRGLRK